MTPQEAAGLLAVAVKYDARLSERTPEDADLAARAWAAAIHRRVTPDFAASYAVSHYATPGALERPRMSPSDVNRAWSRHVTAQQHANTIKAIHAADAVPPTPEYLAAKEALLNRRKSA